MAGKKKSGAKPTMLASAVVTNRQRTRLAAEDPKKLFQAVIVTERNMGVDLGRLVCPDVRSRQLPTLRRMREHHDATHKYVEGEVICLFDPTLKPPMLLGVVRSIKDSKGMHKNPRGSAAAPAPVAAVPAVTAASVAAIPAGAVAAPAIAAAVDPAAAKRARQAGYVQAFRRKGIDPADPSTHNSRPGEQQPVIVYAYNGKLVHRTCSVLYCATLQAVVAANFAEGEVAPLGRYDTPNPDGTHFKGELTLSQLANALLPPDSADIDSQYTADEIQELRARVAGYVIWEHEAVGSPAPAPLAPSSPHPSQDDG